MKKLIMLTVSCMLIISSFGVKAYAGTLDDVINGTEQSTTTTNNQTNETTVETPTTESTTTTAPVTTVENNGSATESTDAYLDNMRKATDLSEPSPGAEKINQGITKVTSFIVQVLSYAVTALLVIRVLLDLCYICLPFTRSILSNGYGGNPEAGAGGMGMQQPGMGGMGMGGMGIGGMGMGGMGGMGMRSGYGMNRGMGMGGMGGIGGMGMQGQSQMGATPAMGRVQWISSAALNAAAAENVLGPDGKSVNPLKKYVGDMVVVLVVTPILLVLAVSGALTSLGFLLGDLLAKAVSNIGNML